MPEQDGVAIGAGIRLQRSGVSWKAKAPGLPLLDSTISASSTASGLSFTDVSSSVTIVAGRPSTSSEAMQSIAPALNPS